MCVYVCVCKVHLTLEISLEAGFEGIGVEVQTFFNACRHNNQYY